MKGIEPIRLTAPDPKSGAATITPHPELVEQCSYALHPPDFQSGASTKLASVPIRALSWIRTNVFRRILITNQVQSTAMR